jgi:hypothetical protein
VCVCVQCVCCAPALHRVLVSLENTRDATTLATTCDNKKPKSKKINKEETNNNKKKKRPRNEGKKKEEGLWKFLESCALHHEVE